MRSTGLRAAAGARVPAKVRFFLHQLPMGFHACSCGCSAVFQPTACCCRSWPKAIVQQALPTFYIGDLAISVAAAVDTRASFAAGLSDLQQSPLLANTWLLRMQQQQQLLIVHVPL